MIQWHTGAKRVETLAFSPDGRTLASVSYLGEVVKLWRPDSTPVGRLAVPFRVQAAGFSPDGRRLAVTGTSRSVLLFDVPAGTVAGRLFAGVRAGELGFAPDGSAAVVLTARRLFWWDRPHLPGTSPNGRRPTGRLDGVYRYDFADSAVAFAPDGRRLVLNNRDDAAVLDVPPTRVLRRVPHPAARIRTQVAVSAGGRVAASHDRDISVWSLDADDPPVTLLGSKKSRSVRGLAFTPDGGLLAVGSDGLARLWDADPGSERQAWDFGLKNLQSLAVSPDGLTAAVGSHDGRIAVWDL